MVLYLARHRQQHETFALIAGAIGLLALLVSFWVAVAQQGDGGQRIAGRSGGAPPVGVQVDQLRARLHRAQRRVTRLLFADLHGSGTDSLIVVHRDARASLRGAFRPPRASDELLIYDQDRGGRLRLAFAFQPRKATFARQRIFGTERPWAWLARIMYARDFDGDHAVELVGAFVAAGGLLTKYEGVVPFALRWYPGPQRYAIESLVGDPPLLAPRRDERLARSRTHREMVATFERPLRLHDVARRSELVGAFLSDVRLFLRLPPAAPIGLRNPVFVVGTYQTGYWWRDGAISSVGVPEQRFWVVVFGRRRVAVHICELFPHGRRPPSWNLYFGGSGAAVRLAGRRRALHPVFGYAQDAPKLFSGRRGVSCFEPISGDEYASWDPR